MSVIDDHTPTRSQQRSAARGLYSTTPTAPTPLASPVYHETPVPEVDADGFAPIAMVPGGRCLVQEGPAVTVKLCHRASGLWVRFPESRCATRCDLTADYEKASDVYLCYGEAGHVAGFALQSCSDGRMLSAHSNRRTWSPSPPRSRAKNGPPDPTAHMTELHLHIRRFGAAELAEYTELNELRFVLDNQYVACPALRHTLHVSVAEESNEVEDCLWLSESRVDAQAWDMYQSKPALHRCCRWCGLWYDSQGFSRCPIAANAQHDSYLLPQYADKDRLLRAAATQHHTSTPQRLEGRLLSHVFSYLGVHSVVSVALVCRGWLALVEGRSTACPSNREWVMAQGFVAASRECAEDGLVLRGRLQRQDRVARVLRHAAFAAAPLGCAVIAGESEGGVHTGGQLWDEQQSAGWLSNTSDGGGGGGGAGRRGLRAKSAEGLCLAALVFSKVEEALRQSAYPCDAETVDLVYVVLFLFSES